MSEDPASWRGCRYRQIRIAQLQHHPPIELQPPDGAAKTRLEYPLIVTGLTGSLQAELDALGQFRVLGETKNSSASG